MCNFINSQCQNSIHGLGEFPYHNLSQFRNEDVSETLNEDTCFSSSWVEFSSIYL